MAEEKKPIVEEQSTEVVNVSNEMQSLTKSNVFMDGNSFAVAMQISDVLAKSDIIPAQFKDKPANCLIALEMANRLAISPMQVMQNLYIVHGNPAWSSKFLIACINSCGRFTQLQYEFRNDEKGLACRAWAFEKATGEKLCGSWVTMQMAQAEGWTSKSGSKWVTMPEQMLRYRSATFFQRTYCPEILFGMQTQDEVEDIAVAEEYHEHEAEEQNVQVEEIKNMINEKVNQ